MDASQPHRLPAVMKSQLTDQLAVFDAANHVWFDCTEKLAHLNMQAWRQILDETQSMSREFAACAGPAEFWAVATKHTQPEVECLSEYGRHVAEVTAEMRDGLGQAVQNELACASRYSGEFMEAGTSTLSPGLGILDHWIKSAVNSSAQRPRSAGNSHGGRKPA